MFRAVTEFPFFKPGTGIKRSNSRKSGLPGCRVCQKPMEDCHDLGWILKGDGLVCFSCRKRLFEKTENREEKILRYLSKRNFKMSKCKYKISIRSLIRESIVRLSQSVRSFFKMEEKKSAQSSDPAAGIPVVELFKPNKDLSDLYKRFSEKSDTELAPVFLEKNERLIEILQNHNLFTLSICEDDWIRGIDPVSEIYSSWNVPVNLLLKRNRNNQIEIIDRKWRKKRNGKSGTVFLAQPFLSDKVLKQRLQLIDAESPETRPDLILFLFRDSGDEND